MSYDKQMSFEIHSFIIFDPTLSKKDEEEQNSILYCHPSTISMGQKMKTIGLCQAMCNFAKEFTTSPCQFIHTLKTRIILHKLENQITIAMTINIPKKSPSSNEYLDDNVQNNICEIILKHCKQNFFLFMGPPSYIIEQNGLQVLIEKLTRFFDRYIDNGMLDGYQITDGLPGVQLLPINEETYSEAKTFVTGLQNKFPDIISSLLLFNNNVVYHTVDKDDLGILYRYLITHLLSKHHVHEAMNSSFTSLNMGKFIIGPNDLSIHQANYNLQKVFLKTNQYLSKSISIPKEAFVIVYKALQAIMVFFIDKDVSLSMEYFINIHNYLGPELTKMTNSLSQKSEKITEASYRYIYWNPDTLCVKSTLFPTRQWKSEFPSLIPLESLRVMNDVKQECDRHGTAKPSSIKEMAVKLQSDSWIIVMENRSKQLFVAINKRNYSLVDVSKEMKHLCNRDFPQIFKMEKE